MAGSPIVVLDIGASKVVCLVGELQDEDRIKVLGVGSRPSLGLRRSVVIDMPRIVDSIRAAIRDTERSAGLKITGAYLGMAGEDISTRSSRSTVAISGTSKPIDENDVDRALVAAEQVDPPGAVTVLHRFVQSYAVDGEHVQNPLWLHGNRLELETLSITASSHACTTLQRATEEAGIEIVDYILETVAASSSVLTLDEREMGVGILDMGAGTTDLAIFNGPLRHVKEIPFGGDDITKDLSVVLNMSPREAEQLKRQYGSVCYREDEDDETISFRTTAGKVHTLTMHQLSEIIEARQHEIFEFVKAEVEDQPSSQMLAAGFIFTGGGALLGNVADLGEEVLGLPVRIGAPQKIIAAESMQDPSYATATGLLRFAADERAREGHLLSRGPAGSRILEKLTKLFSFP